MSRAEKERRVKKTGGRWPVVMRTFQDARDQELEVLEALLRTKPGNASILDEIGYCIRRYESLLNMVFTLSNEAAVKRIPAAPSRDYARQPVADAGKDRDS